MVLVYDVFINKLTKHILKFAINHVLQFLIAIPHYERLVEFSELRASSRPMENFFLTTAGTEPPNIDVSMGEGRLKFEYVYPIFSFPLPGWR